MGNVTIYDVSERAKVGIATVSRVLNSPDQVAPQTRDRVLAAIEDLGFMPKFEARTRARKLLGRIGILTPFLTSASFVDMLNGIRGALVDQPYELVIYDATTVAQRDALLTNIVLSSVVDGLITLHYPLPEPGVRRLVKRRVPLVQLTDTDAPFLDTFSSVAVGPIASIGRMAADYLLARGHTRLGFVGDKGVPAHLRDSARAKLHGFRQTLAKAGIKLPDVYVGRGPFGMEHARDHARRMLTLPEPPTAIFAASDTEAIGVLSAARELGRSLPGELAVMGCDNIEMAEFVGLTTIDTQLNQLGRLAVDLLLAQIADSAAPPQRIDVPLAIVPRETA